MSKKLDEAIEFATERHSGQVRRRESIPYIMHPLEVATIASKMTDDEEVLIAALLHDTVEDTDTTNEEIKERFGERVAKLVSSETENKRPDLPPEETWQIRKEESLEFLKNATDPGVKVLWMADKLSNIRSLYILHEKYGERMWDTFNQKDAKKQQWYYETIAEYLSDLKDTLSYIEYTQLLSIIFKESEING
ncbi:MAG: HD domain-containing protein [Eubacterium sp.]|nr:HD domain-containing protein [Eubacterium sp.]